MRVYDELPKQEQLGLPHGWDELDPNLGSLSLLTRTSVVESAQKVVTGEVISLSLSLSEIDPPLFGRSGHRHSVHQHDRNTFEDELSGWNPQSASQWDGFRHVRAREAGFFGGITDLDAAPTGSLSIEHFAQLGIVGRGVLADVPRWCADRGRAWDPLGGDGFDAADLQRVLEAQGCELEPGSLLCVRLGWVSAYRSLGSDGRRDPLLSQRFSGLRANEDTARLLWNAQVAAICTDNPAVEPAPGNPTDGSLHRRLLPLLGVVMGELFDFDELAERCAESRRFDFLFVAAPLPVPDGLSSPANAVAIL